MMCEAPEFDRDGYPTEGTLETIREWPSDDFPGLAEYVRDAWADYGFVSINLSHNLFGPCLDMICVTGGWSGNECIISALMNNFAFCHMCWESTHRGGLVVFQIPIAD